MAVGGKGQLILTVLASFYALSLALTVLRCYVRIYLKNAFGIDDAFAVATQIVFTGLLVVLTIGIYAGIGQHLLSLSLPEFSKGIKFYFLCELLYVTATCLIKISFSLTLLRIAQARVQRIAIFVVIAVITVFTVFYFFWIIFTCSPVQFFWERVLPEKALGGGSCKDASHMVVATYVHGAVICSADLTLAVLPIGLLWNVQMRKRIKVSVVAILATGSVASVATIARIPYVPRLKSQDFLYDNSDIAIWSVVEIGVSIMATAAATLRPLVVKWKLIRGFSSGSGNKESKRGYVRNISSNFAMEDLPQAKAGRRHGAGSGTETKLYGNLPKTSSEEVIWNGHGGTVSTTREVDTQNDRASAWPGSGMGVFKVTQIPTRSSAGGELVLGGGNC